MRASELRTIVNAATFGGVGDRKQMVALAERWADTERRAATRSPAQLLTDAIGSFVKGGREEEQFIAGMNRQHRTLQTKAAEMFLNWIMQVDGDALVDDRNKVVRDAGAIIATALSEADRIALYRPGIRTTEVENECGYTVVAVRFPVSDVAPTSS